MIMSLALESTTRKKIYPHQNEYIKNSRNITYSRRETVVDMFRLVVSPVMMTVPFSD